jgi:hypothetical protein
VRQQPHRQDAANHTHAIENELAPLDWASPGKQHATPAYDD